MTQFLRILLAILTLLTTLAMLGFAIFGVVVHQWLLVVVCAALTGMFGIFVYHDYQYFFGAKNATTTTTKV
jgi:hypothetical protein